MTRNISCGIYIKEEKQRAISLETLYDRDLKDVLELDRFLGDYAFGDRVDEYIEKLSKAEQRILILYYKEEISCDRIAQLLGISNDAVRQRIHRARCHLKELMVLKKKA